MVTINATIFVQLVLFLIFMYGVKKWILEPMMISMDKRSDDIEQNKDSAKENAVRAETLTDEYAQRVSDARRASLSVVRQAEREAMQKRSQAIARHHATTDERIAEYHTEAMAAVEAQRPEVEKLAPGIAEKIVVQLRTKENAAL